MSDYARLLTCIVHILHDRQVISVLYFQWDYYIRWVLLYSLENAGRKVIVFINDTSKYEKTFILISLL